MPDTALILFLITYVGVALGGFPGLALDRTGIALLGGIAMVASGVLSGREALLAVDYPTLVLLYALMVVSAQLRLGGFYTWVAINLTRLMERPRRFLLVVMLVTAVLSAVLVNDIICLAFTPVLSVALLRAGLNPVPFLLGLAAASNIGSAATIIGNPQNMLIGQVGRLDFGAFLAWCAPPAFVSLIAAYGIILALHRHGLRQERREVSANEERWPDFNAHQTAKGLVATAVIIGCFFTHIPREITAITVAGLLLCSRRMQTRWILDLVDWHLITLFLGLFVVIRGIESSGLPAAALDWLGSHGVDIRSPAVLAAVSGLFSNVVSNVPATMLFVKFLDPAGPVPWYVLALATTLAGNLLTIGSIANLIVIEQASQYGIRITFRRHARVGIPVTLVSFAVLFLWVAWYS